MLYTHAESKDRAVSNFIAQLSKLLKVSRRSIYMYFIRESIVNFKVKEVKYMKGYLAVYEAEGRINVLKINKVVPETPLYEVLTDFWCLYYYYRKRWECWNETSH